MALEELTAIAAAFAGTLSLQEALAALQPLILFIAGMALYSVFVFKFYKFLARREIFPLSAQRRHRKLGDVAAAFEYVFLFPVVAFFWFVVISALMAMFTTVLTISNIFLVSMALLATIRVTAYYKEELSQEIAKLMPLALLATFLLEITKATIEVPVAVLFQLPALGPVLVYYFAFIVVLELVLKALHWTVRRGKGAAQQAKA